MGANPVAAEAYQYFLSKGLSPHQAAAIAGNMGWEGGGKVDLVNPGDNWKNSPRSPHSAGIGQWNDRLPGLIAHAKANGINVPDGDLRDQAYVRKMIQSVPLSTQLDFAYAEMQGPEKWAFDRIKSAQDLREANAGAISYHRPAGWTRKNPYRGHGFDGRMTIAQSVMGTEPHRPSVAMNSGSAGVDPDGFAGVSGAIHTATPGDAGVNIPNLPPPTSIPGPSAPSGAFGAPSMMAGLGKGLGAFAGALGGGGGGGGDEQQFAAMEKANQQALSEDDRRAAEALELVRKRERRSMTPRMGAFG